jgi:hypothetical protein
MQDEIFTALHEFCCSNNCYCSSCSSNCTYCCYRNILCLSDCHLIPIQFRISPEIDAAAKVAAIDDAAAAVKIFAASATAGDAISKNYTKYLLII